MNEPAQPASEPVTDSPAELVDAVPDVDRLRPQPEDAPTRTIRDDDFADARDEELQFREEQSGG